MPQQPIIYPYKPGPIEPDVEPGDNIGVWVDKGMRYYTIDWIEPLPYSDTLSVDLAAGAGLAVAATSAAVQMVALDMPDLEMAKFRVRVLDDCEVGVFQGRGTQRFAAKTRTALIDMFTDIQDPCGHQTTLYVLENQSMFMDAFNPTAYALATARVAVWGYRYVLIALTNKPPKWMKIPAAGYFGSPRQ